MTTLKIFMGKYVMSLETSASYSEVHSFNCFGAISIQRSKISGTATPLFQYILRDHIHTMPGKMYVNFEFCSINYLQQ